MTKQEAAEHLLDAAIDALVDRDDPITAIVLGGSAEDLFQGLLKLEGRERQSARFQLLPHFRAFMAREDPGSPLRNDNVAVNVLRSIFNWLRHADNKDHPQELDYDFHVEAVAVIFRAIDNDECLSGRVTPRVIDLINWERARRAASQ